MGSSLSGWFKGIKGRLLFAAFLPMIGFAILGTVAFTGTHKIVALLDESNGNIIPTFDAIGDMDSSRHQFNTEMWAASTDVLTAEQKKEIIQSAREHIKEYKKSVDYYLSTHQEPDEKKIFEEAKPAIDDYYKEQDTIVHLIESGEPAKILEAQKIMNTTDKATNAKLTEWVRKLNEIYKRMAKDGSEQGAATKKSVEMTVILVTLFSCLAIFGVLLWIAAQVSNSVSGIAERLTTAGNQVATSVEQLNEAGNNLSSSSTEAAASLEETVASLEELTSMVQMNSQNAKQAAELSSSSRIAAEKGEQEIQSLIQSMTDISQSSKKIEEIISVIDDISFQTNLLALNAAVEAARAGEQGKGFAVVAEAVRTLAQRSAASAKDITTLIKESVAQIERGSQIADSSGTVLNNIVNSIKKVSDLNGDIAQASSEQTTGIEQISKAMNQLDQASQSNAASAEEIAATSGEISNLAITAQKLTLELNAVILGSKTTL